VIKLNMPQYTTTTNNVIGSFSGVIAAYRAKIATGEKIYYNDIVNIINLYNSWVGHTHTVTDVLWVAYGNTSPYSDTSESRTTSAPTLPVGPAVPMPDPGKIKMSAAYQNQATNLINAIPATNHGHPIIDAELY
jgi:hypothetical protein